MAFIIIVTYLFIITYWVVILLILVNYLLLIINICYWKPIDIDILIFTEIQVEQVGDTKVLNERIILDNVRWDQVVEYGGP